MAFNKKRWQASNFDEKIGVADGFRRMGDTLFHRVKIGNTFRTGAQGSGTQEITGVGFQPGVVIVQVVITTGASPAWSIGFGSVGQNMCIYTSFTGDATYNHTLCVSWYEAVAPKIWTASITAVGRDGFTITWTKTGDPSNIEINYLCLP